MISNLTIVCYHQNAIRRTLGLTNNNNDNNNNNNNNDDDDDDDDDKKDKDL